LLGLHLGDSDAIIIMDTCGEARLEPARVANGTVSENYWDQPLLPNAAFAVSTSRSGATFAWDVRLTGAGGVYRLCWCASPAETLPHTQAAKSRRNGYVCSIQADFIVDVGALHVVGPSPVIKQDRTCVAGRTCSIDGLRGYELSTTDALLVLETCGVNTAPSEQFPSAGMFSPEAGRKGLGLLERSAFASVAARSYSSTYPDVLPDVQGSGYGDIGGAGDAWSPATAAVGEWLQLDLGANLNFKGKLKQLLQKVV
jgi:hypothetical protein